LVSFYAVIRIYIVAFHESVVQGLLSVFVPFYVLFYVITRWDRCNAYFFVWLSAFVLGFIAGGLFQASAMIEVKPGTQGRIVVPSVLAVQTDADWRLKL